MHAAETSHPAATTSPAVDAAPWTVSLFLVSLGLWAGGTTLFSVGVLPALFMNLESAEAGKIAALLFPIYLRAGLAAGAVTCVAAWMLSRGGGRRWKFVLALLVVMTAAQAWTTVVVHPEMAQIRGVDAHIERFQQLHRLSVRLNTVVLGGGLLLIAAGGFLFARRRDPA